MDMFWTVVATSIWDTERVRRGSQHFCVWTRRGGHKSHKSFACIHGWASGCCWKLFNSWLYHMVVSCRFCRTVEDPEEESPVTSSSSSNASVLYILAVITLLLLAIGWGLTNSLTGFTLALVALALASDSFLPSSIDVIDRSFDVLSPNCW